MSKSFLRYFLTYIWHAQTRQKILLLAVFGLLVSSFSLLVLQSTMGGLQHNLISRSKKIIGTATLQFDAVPEEMALRLIQKLRGQGFKACGELSLELLARNQSYLAPTYVHGLSPHDDCLPDIKINQDMIMGLDLARKLKLDPGERALLISPGYTDSMIGDLPRQISANLQDYFLSDVPDIDIFHTWMPIIDIQNLVGEKVYNTIRIFSPITQADFQKFQADTSFPIKLTTWEQEHQTLVYALKLENMVMLFLFISMTLLVSIAITSGFLIFFKKIKTDLIAFWILGTSIQDIEKLAKKFLYLLSFSASTAGLILGIFALTLVDRFSYLIMPQVFVERKIPVLITFTGLSLSFLIPCIVSVVFGHLALKDFRTKQDDFIQVLRNNM